MTTHLPLTSVGSRLSEAASICSGRARTEIGALRGTVISKGPLEDAPASGIVQALPAAVDDTASSNQTSVAPAERSQRS